MVAPRVSAPTNHVDPVATPIGMQAVKDALSTAFESEMGKVPTKKTTKILAAQVALETGRTQAMINYNFGGIKGTGPSGLTTKYRTEEGDGATRVTIRDNFRAYQTKEEGAKDYVHLLHTRFNDALSAAERGDSHAFVHSLKTHGYFTGNEAAYTHAVDTLSGENFPAGANRALSGPHAQGGVGPDLPPSAAEVADRMDRIDEATLASLETVERHDSRIEERRRHHLMSNITRLPFDWSKKTVLVTGGTGSFGRVFVRNMLDAQKAAKVIVFSRDELKQHEMRTGGFDDSRLRYFIGDVRDKDRLTRAMNGVDVVVHAAALKQVPACEYNPIEAVMTNVNGSRNVIEAALDAGVSRVLALSTDKAVNPANLYGATKLVAEKLFVQANAYRGDGPTRFSCVRYGNVVGSRGSVVPLFSQQRAKGELTITDPSMTRFWLTLDQGVAFVTQCIEGMCGGEVFIPKLKTMNIVDLATAMAPECRIRTVGIRPGEKLHEALLSDEEISRTIDVGSMYVVRPAHPWWTTSNWQGGELVPQDFSLVSNTAPDRLSVDELMNMIGKAA